MKRRNWKLGRGRLRGWFRGADVLPAQGVSQDRRPGIHAAGGGLSARHAPASNISYVSTVGTKSKLMAYGNNRADWSFIPGGLVPGFIVVNPDLPERKDEAFSVV